MNWERLHFPCRKCLPLMGTLVFVIGVMWYLNSTQINNHCDVNISKKQTKQASKENQPTKINLAKMAKVAAREKFQDRRKMIAQYCATNKKDKALTDVNRDPKWNEELWYDYKNYLLFCQISKVSSTTWINHLMR